MSRPLTQIIPRIHLGMGEESSRSPVSQSVEISGQDVKCEGLPLASQLLLYSVEQASKLPRALCSCTWQSSGAEVRREKWWEAVGKCYLEQCVPRSRWVAPPIVEHRQVAQKPGRM